MPRVDQVFQPDEAAQGAGAAEASAQGQRCPTFSLPFFLLYLFAMLGAFLSSALAAVAGESCAPPSCLVGTCFEDRDCQNRCQNGSDDKPEEQKHDYGPPCAESRKTLLQWSYGTSFSGGPAKPDEPLEADRPGFSAASSTVGRGVVQVESGYTFILDRSGGVETTQHDFPQMLWRCGVLADWLELRLQYSYGIQDVTPNRGPAQHTSGSDDLDLGMKIGLTPQEKLLPQMALLTTMSVPTGSPGRTAGEVLPSVGLCSSWELSKCVGLSMETQLSRARDESDNTYTQFAQSLSVGYKLTKDLSSFTEWYVLAPSGETVDRTQHYLDGGFTYHVTNNLQLDIEAGVGLNSAADNFFAGSGVVIRY